MQIGTCYVKGPRGCTTQFVIPWGHRGGITPIVYLENEPKIHENK